MIMAAAMITGQNTGTSNGYFFAGCLGFLSFFFSLLFDLLSFPSSLSTKDNLLPRKFSSFGFKVAEKDKTLYSSRVERKTSVTQMVVFPQT